MKRLLTIASVLLATLIASAQAGFDPSNPPEPAAKYKLTVKVQPEEAATPSGSGQYSEGQSVSVRATAKANYVFKYWTQNGEQLSTASASFNLAMPAEDVTLVAVFEYQEPTFNPKDPAEPQATDPEYSLYLIADPAGGGSFNRSSGNKAKEGETLSLRASAATGYRLIGWYDITGKELGTDNILSFTMPGKATTLTARFEYNPADPSEPAGSQEDVDNTARFITFEDSKVEAICLEKWDKDGDGKLSEGEAAAVTSLENAFTGTEIETFAELKYFTSLSMIEADGFLKCKQLTTLTLPEGICEIGDNAFTNCQGLTALHLPASLTRISDQSVFYNCMNLTGFTVDTANNSYSAEDGILYSKDKSVLVCCPPTKSGFITLLPTVTTLENSAFGMCDKITGIKLPAGITIGEGAFVGCSGLTSVDFTADSESSATTIGIGSFNACSNLTDFTVDGNKDGVIGVYYKVIDGVLFSTWSDGKLGGLLAYPAAHGSEYTVPDGTETIGYYAFVMTGIKEVTLPSSLKNILEYAFAYCENLQKMTVKAVTPPSCTGAFEQTDLSKAVLYVPAGKKPLYQADDTWNKFYDIEELDAESGDANIDGFVDAVDIVTIANYIMFNNMTENQRKASDANNDNNINIADIVRIVNCILAK